MILKLLKGSGLYDLHARVRSVQFRRDASGAFADVTFEGAEGPQTFTLSGNAFVLDDKGNTLDRFNLQEGR